MQPLFHKVFQTELQTSRQRGTSGTDTHTYTYGNSAWADLLTAYDGHSIAYEGQSYNRSTGSVSGDPVSGNPIGYYNGSTYEFEWQNGFELHTVNLNSQSIVYSYDANGVRNRKNVDGEIWDYLTQNGQIVRAVHGAQILDVIYDNNCDPYALNYSSDGGRSFTTYYYLRDLKGDVVKLLDATGAVVANYSYDVWGKVLSVTDSSGNLVSAEHIGRINPIRYRGYVYDEETGFYYLKSRYYDPEIGRFLNADGVLDNRGSMVQNLFTYCGNNPINNSDSNGHIFGGIVGGIVGGVLGGITAAASGKSVKAGIVTGAIFGAITGAICDATLPLFVATMACAGVAALGNLCNQGINYVIERNKYKRNTKNNTSKKSNNNTSTSIPKKYQSFKNYVEIRPIVTAGIAACICAPISVKIGNVAEGMFHSIPKSGIMTASRFIVETVLGADVSMLQTSTEYVIPIFETDK